jgi:gamma-glutamylcyclotransferase (GGCT)/AIG2-like uncharacterized protein YtfP
MGERKRQTGSFEVERTTGSREVLDRLFVYGTLRDGQTARSLVANQITGAAAATTEGSLYAFPMGYPGYVEDGAGTVRGEVLWLTELAATFALLDAYEGTDFVRMIRQVTLETGEQTWAWIYVLSDPAAVKHGTRIDHGDWVRYWTEQS